MPDTPIYSMTDTWNAAGTAFRGIKMTITDTASAAGSKAVEILGGAAGTTDLFSITKTGAATAAGKTLANLSDVQTFLESITFALPSSGAVTVRGAAGDSARFRLFNNAAVANGGILGQGLATGTDNVVFLWNTGNNSLSLGTNNVQRFLITGGGELSAQPGNTGHLGITGATGDSARLRLFNNAASTNGGLIGQGLFSGTDNIVFVWNTGNADLSLGTNNTARVTIQADGTTVFAAPARMAQYTVAALPTGAAGMRAYVTNALAPAFGAAVVGGGAVGIPVYHDGVSWKVG
jgi:hypothetical protein